MDKKQANAIADELLEPANAARAQSEQERALAAERQQANTIKAWLMLAGFACGALIACATGARIARSGLLGGFFGLALSYLVNYLRRSR